MTDPRIYFPVAEQGRSIQGHAQVFVATAPAIEDPLPAEAFDVETALYAWAFLSEYQPWQGTLCWKPSVGDPAVHRRWQGGSAHLATLLAIADRAAGLCSVRLGAPPPHEASPGGGLALWATGELTDEGVFAKGNLNLSLKLQLFAEFSRTHRGPSVFLAPWACKQDVYQGLGALLEAGPLLERDFYPGLSLGPLTRPMVLWVQPFSVGDLLFWLTEERLILSRGLRVGRRPALAGAVERSPELAEIQAAHLRLPRRSPADEVFSRRAEASALLSKLTAQSGEGSAPAFLGWAVAQSWGPEPPAFNTVGGELAGLHEGGAKPPDLTLLQELHIVAADGGVVDPAPVRGLAAHGVCLACEDGQEAAGLALVRWMLDRAERLTYSRLKLLEVLLAWWPKARAHAAEGLKESIRARPPSDRLARLRLLVRLSLSELILERAEAANGKKEAPAVEQRSWVGWARRSALSAYVPHLLDLVGEGRAQAYLEAIRETQVPDERLHLAQSLRHLVQQGRPLELPSDDSVGIAVRASLSDAPAEAIERLKDDPEAKELWLGLLTVPLTATQTDLLLDLTHHPSDRASALASQCLAAHGDLTDRVASHRSISARGGTGLPAELGEVLGGYRLEAIIGRGSMGVVYSGVHVHLGRKAAVKVLSPDLAADGAHIARFLREAKIANDVHHPCIVDISDFVETEAPHRVAYVMELLFGPTLREALAERRFSVVQAINVCLQVADVLESVHAAGVVHRDIKPENLILTGDLASDLSAVPSVKVLDFGIAKLRSSHSSSTLSTSWLIGTPAYMAPEQITGAAVTSAADVYALGELLVEILTGKRAFLGDSRAILKRKLSSEPPEVWLPCGLGDRLRALVARCLSERALDRPSISAFKAELSEALRGPVNEAALVEDLGSSPALSEDQAPGADTEESARSQLIPAPKSERRFWVAAVGAGLVISALLAGRFWATPKEPTLTGQPPGFPGPTVDLPRQAPPPSVPGTEDQRDSGILTTSSEGPSKDGASARTRVRRSRPMAPSAGPAVPRVDAAPAAETVQTGPGELPPVPISKDDMQPW